MQKLVVRVCSFLVLASVGPIAACAMEAPPEETQETEQAAKKAASGTAKTAAPPAKPAPDARCGRVDFATLYLFNASIEVPVPPRAEDDEIGEKQEAAIQRECTRQLVLDKNFSISKTPVDPHYRPVECGTCPKGKTGCDMTNLRGSFNTERFMKDDTEMVRCTSSHSREGNANDGYKDIYSVQLQYDCAACTGPGCAPTGSSSGTASGVPSSSASTPPSGSSSAPAPSPSGSSTAGE